MDWLPILVAAGGAVWGGRYLWVRQVGRRTGRKELEGIRRLADEDVTLLGEELSRLDAEVSAMDHEARADYQKALDAYESAQQAVPRLRSADEVSKITDTLSIGRYAMVCVRARVSDQPVPEWRVPCFFNPQHGPSVRDVRFTPAGRGTRLVPACAQDAARVANRESPQIRTVQIRGREVPYWEAGSAYLPYAQGYFVGTPLIAMGMFASDIAGGGGFNADYGGAGGFEGGGFDGGGFEGGGFDGGGGI